jgi:hypothetical protein
MVSVCFALVACNGDASSRARPGAPSAADGGSSAEAPRRILSQNRYWAKPGKADEVYAWRLHATDVQVEMGLPRGRVLRGAGGEEPDVIWQIEQTPEERAEFLRIQKEKMAMFQPVMEHMSTLTRRFESGAYAEIEHREHAKPEAEAK